METEDRLSSLERFTKESIDKLLMKDEDLEQRLLTLIRKEKLDDHALRVEALKSLFSSTISQSKAYANVIFGLGYASFFAAWTGLRATVPKWSATVSILCVAGSMLLFVSFEIVQMWTVNRYHRKVGELLWRKGIFPDLDTLEKVRFEYAMRVFRIWTFLFYPTVFFAFAGGGVFVSGLVMSIA